MKVPITPFIGARRAALAIRTLIVGGFALGFADTAAAATFCTDTAKAVYNACGFEVQDDYWIAIANCINESEATDRQACRADAADARAEGNSLCKEQLAGRLGACATVGEGRYDPEFEPQMFDTDFAHLTHPNRYFPLRIGNRWEYAGGGETNTVEITSETKLIDDVRCIVSRDLVYEDGRLKEATDDWFAQAKSGAVWYCGEEVKNYETFKGDKPRRPELVSIDGAFKADRDFAKPGIIFLARPTVGAAYLEEFSLANAEDMSEILSTTYAYGTDKELDRLVPRALARQLCHGDCVVTENISLLEPGIVERKYYAPGIGVFLETNPSSEDGEITQLVNCNFDARCNSLPPPLP
jgi:hypothetical protein